MNPESTTIAAIATAPGAGAIAVIRLSGPQSNHIAARATGRNSFIPRHATLSKIKSDRGTVIDEVLVTAFSAPASFTGEDTVEISCHGGMFVAQRVLERLLDCGAVPAEPGEFSRRAFENGKMDLTQAEAVMDIINAGSDLALRAAQNQLSGAIAERVKRQTDKIIDLAALIEAYIDFPEEDIPLHTTEQLSQELSVVEDALRTLLQTAESGRVLREGARTAIIGAPNAGKSSLLNMLLGYERAIVSNIEGTTRDTIEESVILGGLRIRLIDTAGLRESVDPLERQGIERSRRAMQEADLVLEVADASQPPPSTTNGDTSRKILILNKSDLNEHPAWANRRAVRLSCKKQQGLPALEEAIRDFFLRDIGESDTLAAINTRHRHALRTALQALENAAGQIELGSSPELIDIELRAALDALGSITGKIDTEDILDRVFSTFCLGK